MSNIAYSHEEITLDKAVWDTQYGMWAQFVLTAPDDDEKRANPFKTFTKRRKGKVGTRFGAVFVNADESNAYNDDVMLKGWTDGTAGWKVSFFVNSDEAGFHPFMHYDKGHIFSVAMVEIDDDETVINQTKRNRLESAKRGRRSFRLSNFAAQLCKDPKFIRYIGDRCGQQPSSPEHAEEFSSEWMRKTLKIGSRRDLDTDRDAATAFHKHIREPYNKWYKSKYG